MQFITTIADAKEYYKEAHKMALKRFSKDKKPLTSLIHLPDKINTLSKITLGTMDIPLKKISGCYSDLRSNSFSTDYMPLSAINTEFADKWIHLAIYHLNEGITDPIKVYEYLGYYYVIEGNKRVSVLKYFKSFSIRAEVIRLMPKKLPKGIYNE